MQHLIVFITIATFRILSVGKTESNKELHISISELRIPLEKS
nr:MAG TPA: hypothetical protein [Caudoviricetes sp.]